MCAIEHTHSSDGGYAARATASSERVVVGHEAHASAFSEPSYFVVREFLDSYMSEVVLEGNSLACQSGLSPQLCGTELIEVNFSFS
jgi:hypothetical protein